MASNGENKQLPPLLSFPRFSELVPELRAQIWHHALDNATTNRVIPVVVNHHPAVTMHSCLHLQGTFCGQHDHCPSYNADSGQPSSSVSCMFNGYFCLPPDSRIPDQDLRNLSLVCTESRSVVLTRYPETITLYRGMRYPDAKSPQRRPVRCDPATDTLLVKAAGNYISEQKHPSPFRNDPGDFYHEATKKWFPQDADIFANFRHSISRFKHVVISFLSDFETPRESLFLDVFNDKLFQRFLVFFERLERLHVCFGTMYASPVREWERVEELPVRNRGDSSVNAMAVQTVAGISGDTLNCEHRYMDYMQLQGELSANIRDCCWVPTPKGFGGSWLFSSGELFDKSWDDERGS